MLRQLQEERKGGNKCQRQFGFAHGDKEEEEPKIKKPLVFPARVAGRPVTLVAAAGNGGDAEVIHPLPQLYTNKSQRMLLATLSLQGINLRSPPTSQQLGKRRLGVGEAGSPISTRATRGFCNMALTS